MRSAIALALLLVTAFCVWGLIAAGEPGPNQIYFRIGYPLVGIIALVVAVALLKGEHRRS